MNLSERFRQIAHQLRVDFEEVSNVVAHHVSSGQAREEALRELLAAHLPNRAAVGTGFVIDRQGSESRQIDVVIYDVEHCPMFTIGGVNYYPCEGVLAVGEVKADISSRTRLGEALENVGSVKALDRRSDLPVTGPGYSISGLSFDPTTEYRDQIFAFIYAGGNLSRDLAVKTLRQWNGNHVRSQWPNLVCWHQRFLISYEVPGALQPNPMDATYLYCTEDTEAEHLLLLFFCVLAEFVQGAHVARVPYFEYGGVKSSQARYYALFEDPQDHTD